MTDVELTETICRLLGGIEGWEYRESGGAYPESVVGVFYGSVDTKPNRAVGVRVYFSTDGRDEPTSKRVQLHVRGAVRNRSGADELAGSAFAALHGLSRVQGISGISRLSMSPLGADTNGREERTENYLIILDNPEASS